MDKQIKIIIADDQQIVPIDPVSVMTAASDMELIVAASASYDEIEKLSLNLPDVEVIDLEIQGEDGSETITAIRRLSAVRLALQAIRDSRSKEQPQS